MSGLLAAAAWTLAGVGALAMLIAALGAARFRDTYARLHCAGKSATLGVACMLSAAALWFADPAVAARCLLAAAFFLITGPIGCHAVARALWRSRR